MRIDHLPRGVHYKGRSVFEFDSAIDEVVRFILDMRSVDESFVFKSSADSSFPRSAVNQLIIDSGVIMDLLTEIVSVCVVVVFINPIGPIWVGFFGS